MIVVPHGDAYALSSAPELPQRPDAGRRSSDWFTQMASGGCQPSCAKAVRDQCRCTIVCGFLGCDARPFNPVLATLPKLLRPAAPAAQRERDRLRSARRICSSAESHDRRAGSRSVLLRIGELMFVEVVRRHLGTVTAADGGWLAGLRDPLVGRVLEQMHREPGRDWTLDELARRSATSRSVLAERFTYFVGEPPMRYLTRWRLQRAAGLLAGGSAKVSTVAREVGYDSEAAFSRAFKRHTGVTPAAWGHRRPL